jgi:predicted regulator of Ras-like GTPase activity (Roadblock/LC7/MglB family)
MSSAPSALESLTGIPGVRGAMLANRDDGIVVAEAVMEDVDSGALAALASSLARRLEQAAATARGGAAGFFHLQASNGALFVAPAGTDMLLVVIADKGVNVGRARLEMSRVAEAQA